MSENEKAANFGDLYISLEKNFDIECQLINFGETEHNKKGNRYQDCVLSDGQEQQKVKIWEGRTGIPLEEKNRNQWLTFNLSARAGTGKWKDNKYIGGFWDSSAAVIDSPQNTQQGVQQPTGATKASQPTPVDKKEPDWEAIAEGKVRHGVVCAFIAARHKPEVKEVERWVRYIITGIDLANVPDPHSDIQTKKCVNCGALDETQCSCVPW